eukprot:GHVS01104482.1.p2 GENE.GHVS01104482.1~~GHVS01104482.1.p2  ORF type:complete len:118 (-),score=25.50 GHVS01104482.1:172-525(-)
MTSSSTRRGSRRGGRVPPIEHMTYWGPDCLGGGGRQEIFCVLEGTSTMYISTVFASAGSSSRLSKETNKYRQDEEGTGSGSGCRKSSTCRTALKRRMAGDCRRRISLSGYRRTCPSF